jgi:hypothetical protein
MFYKRRIYEKKAADFSKINYNTKFKMPKLSGAGVSATIYFCTDVIFVLFIEEE